MPARSCHRAVCLAAFLLGGAAAPRPVWAQRPAAPADAVSADAALAAAEGRFVRALTDHFLGNDSAAVRQFERLLATRPGDGAVLDALAESYAALGRPTEALYHAGLAADAAPDEASVYVRLGVLQARAGQRDAARASVETAVRLRPTDAGSLAALADLHAAAGRTDAEREALEALVAVGETPAAWRRLSALYSATGDRERAERALRQALRLAPGDAALRERVAALNGPSASPAASSPDAAVSSAAVSGADEALAVVADDPRRLDAWAIALTALARTADPRAGETADEATLLFPTVPSILAPAAEAYLAAARPADAARAARAGLAALDAARDTAPDALSLRSRLDRALAAASP